MSDPRPRLVVQLVGTSLEMGLQSYNKIFFLDIQMGHMTYKDKKKKCDS